MAVADVIPQRELELHRVNTRYLLAELLAAVLSLADYALVYVPRLETPARAIEKSVQATLRQCAAAYERGDELCVLPDYVLFSRFIAEEKLVAYVKQAAGKSFDSAKFYTDDKHSASAIVYWLKPPQLNTPPHV